VTIDNELQQDHLRITTGSSTRALEHVARACVVRRHPRNVSAILDVNNVIESATDDTVPSTIVRWVRIRHCPSHGQSLLRLGHEVTHGWK